ncbi:MAG: hypothetical protein KJ077_06850 [Anaerolineae bacterium]|nr:hypothetical protein [Anaerolineae bacterium]
MKQWYTLYTKPHAEYQVAAALQQREIEIYLPEIKGVKPGQRGQKKPFFPCYLFMNADFETIGLSFVQWTPGLRRIVTFDDRPTPLPHEIISFFQRKLGEIQTNDSLPIHPFELGDAVYITDGPFCDMLAIFDGPTTPSKRVQVLLTILGQVSRVQIDVGDLEKALPGTEAPLRPRPRGTRGQGRYIKGTI